jgi:hypothetical protein
MMCAGRYAGWGVRRDGPGLRIVLGWIAFLLLPRDLELMVAHLNIHTDELLTKYEQLRATLDAAP